MKALATLTAVAALVAGVSMANAAGMQKHTLTGSSSNNAQFCLKTDSGALNCKFASMDACRKVAGSEGAICITNPKSSSTTGSGMSSDSYKK